MTQPHQTLVPSPSDRIICFKVGKVKRENLYEMTRKYWKVNILRARNATHALAITDGVVQAVYLPFRWYLTEDPMSLGRYELIQTVRKHRNPCQRHCPGLRGVHRQKPGRSLGDV